MSALPAPALLTPDVSRNGHAGTTPRKATRRKSAGRTSAQPTPAPSHDHLRAYAAIGVVFLSALSAGLNAYANAQHASVAWAGAALGVAIPLTILLLGKVAGLLYRREYRRLALVTASTGVGLLLLSVCHCASSLSELTGSSLILAFPMAVAVDVGFVCCEAALLVE